MWRRRARRRCGDDCARGRSRSCFQAAELLVMRYSGGLHLLCERASSAFKTGERSLQRHSLVPWGGKPSRLRDPE